MTPEDSPNREKKLVGMRFKTRIKQPTPIRNKSGDISDNSGSTHNRFGFRLTD